jgi:hypothetical protein
MFNRRHQGLGLFYGLGVAGITALAIGAYIMLTNRRSSVVKVIKHTHVASPRKRTRAHATNNHAGHARHA